MRIPATSRVLNADAATIIFNESLHEQRANVLFYQLKKDEPVLPQVLQALVDRHIQSVLVEGGSTLLQQFIDAGFWDEARVITNPELIVDRGTIAPRLNTAQLILAEKAGGDEIAYYRRIHN